MTQSGCVKNPALRFESRNRQDQDEQKARLEQYFVVGNMPARLSRGDALVRRSRA